MLFIDVFHPCCTVDSIIRRLKRCTSDEKRLSLRWQLRAIESHSAMTTKTQSFAASSSANDVGEDPLSLPSLDALSGLKILDACVNDDVPRKISDGSLWKKPYYEYRMSVMSSRVKWDTYHRFSDFVKLYSEPAVSSFVSALPKLPPKWCGCGYIVVVLLSRCVWHLFMMFMSE